MVALTFQPPVSLRSQVAIKKKLVLVNVKNEFKEQQRGQGEQYICNLVIQWEAPRLHVPSCAAPDAIAANQHDPPGPPPVAHPVYEERNNVCVP